jgi:hypothetical protein
MISLGDIFKIMDISLLVAADTDIFGEFKPLPERIIFLSLRGQETMGTCNNQTYNPYENQVIYRQ